MKKLITLAFLTLFAGLASSTPGFREDPPTQPGGTQATLQKETDLNAVRMSVANGVIDYVNGAKRAILNLEWEYLPTEDSLLKSVRTTGLDSGHGSKAPNKPFVFHIRNRDLYSGNWFQKLPTSAKDVLASIVPGVDASYYETAKLGYAEQKFADYWKKPGGAGFEAATGLAPSVKARDYYCLQRDFLLLTGLLRSKGITYSVNVSGAEVRGENPRFSNPAEDNVDWKITVYPFLVKAPPNPVRVYRFSIKASMKPVPLLFPNASETEAGIGVGIDFTGGSTGMGLLQRSFLAADTKLALSPAVEEKLEKLTTENAASDLETTLKIVGGVDLGQVVTSGLLGGTANASIVAGSLVGAGKVSQVVGVNQEFVNSGESTLGLFIGVQPGDDNTLFIGPSIRASILTLAAGLRVYERDKLGSSQKETKSSLAGIVSFDLSRLSGSKKEVTKITLKDSSVGGDIGKASDLIAQDLSLLKWSLSSPTPTPSFTLVQMKDRDGNEITDVSKQARIVITPGTNQLIFLPAGVYRYEDIPAGYRLKASALSEPIENGKTVPITSELRQEISWILLAIE